MIRKQIYITKEQEQFLKEQSSRKGMTEAELVRRALDAFIKTKTTITKNQQLIKWNNIKKKSGMTTS